MAIFTGTAITYDMKGLRESLSDVIYNIAPEETPGISGASREGAEAVLEEWQTDTLAAAVTNNQVIEGDDIASVAAAVATKRLGNYNQISRKTLAVSGTQERVSKAGRKSELAYQLSKKSPELKLDMEKHMFSYNGGGVAGDTTTARVAAGLLGFVFTNDVFAGDGGKAGTFAGSGVPDGGRTDGTPRALTTTLLNDVGELCWVSGAKPSVLMVGPKNKKVISGLTTVVTRNFDLSNVEPAPTAIIAAVDVYVGDFGTYRVVPNRNSRDRDVWFIDYEYLCLGELRPFFIKQLADTGDAEKRALYIEYTVKVKNEAAFGLIADLTTP